MGQAVELKGRVAMRYLQWTLWSSIAFLFLLFPAEAQKVDPTAPQASGPPLIQPAELADLLRSGKSPRPLLFQVGFRVLFLQAHIPNSEYITAGSSPNGVRALRERVEKLPRTQSIILYCGCCPWSHCPNVLPASETLRSMGFKNVKVLFIAQDFGTDWVSKGYPTAKGE